MEEDIIPASGDEEGVPAGVDEGPVAGVDDEEDALDRLRDMPVGVNDPNIIGDAGPTDVPPGGDPPSPAPPDGELAGETPA
jgi:hypothetical protein